MATADARADVWSLGVCLYYLISGEPPFAEEHLGRIVGGHQRTTRRPTRHVDSAIPSEVADIVERALEKNLTRRYQDVRELAEELEPFGVDAGTVVGIAWRISNVLRPRTPIAIVGLADAPRRSVRGGHRAEACARRRGGHRYGTDRPQGGDDARDRATGTSSVDGDDARVGEAIVRAQRRRRPRSMSRPRGRLDRSRRGGRGSR